MVIKPKLNGSLKITARVWLSTITLKANPSRLPKGESYRFSPFPISPYPALSRDRRAGSVKDSGTGTGSSHLWSAISFFLKLRSGTRSTGLS
jgi:hypothetical protein